jgi:hypothetical protein
MPEPTSDHDLLIRLDEKVSGMVGKLDSMTNDHESRIRALERWRWYAAGIGTLGGTVFAPLISELIHRLSS